MSKDIIYKCATPVKLHDEQMPGQKTFLLFFNYNPQVLPLRPEIKAHIY